jgi:hypothetical protein
MARTWKKDSSFDTTPEQLVGILTSEAFHIAHQKLDKAIKHADFKELARTDESATFKIECVQYSRGMIGIDKSKTENSTTSFNWDLKNMFASWVHTGAHGDKVKASGTEKVTASGSGATLSSTFDVQVEIPLIGGQIEKLVIKDAEKSRPQFESLIRDFIKRSA